MEFVDTTQVDHSTVELADRTGGEERFEFVFDGRPWIKPQGKATWNLPRYVACWLLKHNRDTVWTTEGAYTHRFGLGANEDAVQQSLVADLGKSVEDITPIAIDRKSVEGWDTRGTERTGPGTQVRLTGDALRATKAALREHIGGAARPAFAP